MLRFAKILSAATRDGLRALFLQVRGFGQEGDDDAAEKHDDVDVLQPLGLFARPVATATLQVLLAELGEQLVGLWQGDRKAARIDAEEGETQLYGAKEASVRVRLRADGSLDIEAKSAQAIRLTASGGGDVVVNGGTAKVARVGDTVDRDGLFATWLQGVAAAASYPNPLPSTFGTISSGADHFKG